MRDERGGTGANGREVVPLPRYSPAQGGKSLTSLDQDSLECEAGVSVWGIGRNV